MVICLADIFLFPYLYQYLLKLHTGVYTQYGNALEVLSKQCEIFYICKPYLFFHIYDPLSIPCLAVTFEFCKCLLIFYCNS